MIKKEGINITLTVYKNTIGPYVSGFSDIYKNYKVPEDIKEKALEAVSNRGDIFYRVGKSVNNLGSSYINGIKKSTGMKLLKLSADNAKLQLLDKGTLYSQSGIGLGLGASAGALYGIISDQSLLGRISSITIGSIFGLVSPILFNKITERIRNIK